MPAFEEIHIQEESDRLIKDSNPTTAHQAIEQQPITDRATPVGDDSSPSTGTSSPVSSNASSRPIGNIFRMRRHVRGQGPSSDPESFYSTTRMEYWRRAGQVPTTNAQLAWLATNPLRPTSPTRRSSSAIITNDWNNVVLHDFRHEWSSGRVHHVSAQPRDLTGQIIPSYNHPSARGGFADIWIATWEDKKVAVKVLRLSADREDRAKKLKKRLRRELRVWQRLSHDHILPLYGITTDFGPNVSMVCPWMDNGTLTCYLELHDATLTPYARFKILCGVAAGLLYLHSSNVIHGDLTGSNILIDASGQALLSDFGLSVILAECQGPSYLTSSIHGAVRYAAPEIYAPQSNEHPTSVRVSTYSDVYSFGSVTLQTLSGKVPFHYLRNDAMVLWELFGGGFPQRPAERWVTDDNWAFITGCWNRDPFERPTIHQVVSYVELRHNESCARHVHLLQ